MDQATFEKKLMGAGITDPRLLAIIVLHVFTPEINEDTLDAFLETGGAVTFEDMARRSDALESGDRPLAVLRKAVGNRSDSNVQ